MKQIRVVLIGAGLRGKVYTDYALQFPERFKVVAVAEKLEARRKYIQEAHGIPDSLCFADWKDLLRQPKLADAAIISTMDREHFGPAMLAIAQKYSLLLEKPMSWCPEECFAISKAAAENHVQVLVCHVLRFTAFFTRIKRLIEEGRIGKIMNVVHMENVGNIHQSHSFVRGNWRNDAESSPMILQKCCHDMDILQWLIGARCRRVQSFGSLTHFTKENKPLGAPHRCTEGCPHGDTCCYNAIKLYLEDTQNDWFRTAAAHKVHPTDQDIRDALERTQYGVCVYDCDNSVVDHQTVNLEFEDQTTVAFSMCAFNEGGRYLRIMGTKGELTANMSENTLTLYDFETRSQKAVEVEGGDIDPLDSHGGGDTGIMHAFWELLNGQYADSSICDVETSARNHLIAFAAEKSRLENTIVDMRQYESEVLSGL